ncbi:hypothetical protein AVEN_177994-1 [Araneus ventricosus]|uniref:Uncharacterized protein n=1 Tax=Araneus ventricosus TaxID=182803 RepID=A0A4Y2EJ00_ARAVE|nr:hypothetical protein AVEN_177994-1 [Araneus ventricosus]
MKVVLMDCGCWSFIIEEDKPCPEQATEKEKFEYDWRKQRCYTTIYQGIERKFFPLIRHTTDSKEAWNILKTGITMQAFSIKNISSVRSERPKFMELGKNGNGLLIVVEKLKNTRQRY